MTQSAVNDIIRTLQNAAKILLTAHRDPDGDSLGSQLAMHAYLISIGKTVLMCNEGAIPTRYLFLDGVEKVKTQPENVSFDPDLVVVLESTSLERVGKVINLIPADCTVVNIDHHVGNCLYGDINLVDEKASSVAEVLHRILKAAGFEYTKSTAECLFTAILTDTGRFRFSSTTPNSLRICADLIEAGADPRELTDRIYFSKSRDQMQVLGEAMQGCELTLDGKLCIMTLSNDMLAKRGLSFSDFEGMVDYSMYLKDIVIGALLKDVSANVTKVSLRSRNSFDVSELARRFGGGGHLNAAGATIAMPLQQAREALLGAAGEMLSNYDE